MNHTASLNVAAHGDLEIVITRTFDAPRELAFEAMTRPDLVRRWMTGPPGWTMTVSESDLRVGGGFRHVWKGDDGTEMSMHGEYREVVPPQRIVRTESFDTGCDDQGGEQLASLVLTEEDGGRTTAVRITVLFPTREARDGMLASGMEHGIDAGYRNLDQVLDELSR